MISRSRVNALVGLVLLAGGHMAQAQTPTSSAPVYVYANDSNNLDYAITAIKDGTIYDHAPGYSSPNNPIAADQFGGPTNAIVGKFHAGELFCADLPTGGPGGPVPEFGYTTNDPIELRGPNYPSGSLDGSAPDNGDFVPSPTVGGCARLAQSMPLSQVKVGTEPLYLSPFVQQTIGVTAAILIFGGLALWHIFSGIAAEKPEARARLWEERKEGYSLNEYTGEWQRIRSRNPGTGSIIIDTQSRSQRIVAEKNGRSGRLVMAFLAEGWAFLLALGWAYFPDSPMGGMLVMLGLPLVGWAVFKQIQYNTGYGGHLVIDPPREERTDNPFGPASATSPVDHPASDDLSYKPTV